MFTIRIEFPSSLFLKDPQASELGKKIVAHSIVMIDKLGFEQFTFKKLAEEIHSTEASVYRYFENKHRLLLYLTTWYWHWLDFKIDYDTHLIADPKTKLEAALRIIAYKLSPENLSEQIDFRLLNRVVLAEADKTYLTKMVDSDNKDGLFMGYKTVCKKLAAMVMAINPRYPFSHALISMLLEAAHQQLFFAQHLPSLTELSKLQPHEQADSLYQFLHSILFNAIKE